LQATVAVSLREISCLHERNLVHHGVFECTPARLQPQHGVFAASPNEWQQILRGGSEPLPLRRGPDADRAHTAVTAAQEARPCVWGHARLPPFSKPDSNRLALNS
jgi:hypothetical protein